MFTASALAVEVLFTTALVLVVLNVAATRATEGNSFYGLAIGFTILAAAFAGGPISGGAFNPAVGVGATLSAALFNNGSWSDLWLYLVGQPYRMCHRCNSVPIGSSARRRSCNACVADRERELKRKLTGEQAAEWAPLTRRRGWFEARDSSSSPSDRPTRWPVAPVAGPPESLLHAAIRLFWLRCVYVTGC